MKKIAIAMAMAATLALSACGSDGGNDTAQSNSQGNTSTQDENKDNSSGSGESSGPIALTLWGAEDDQKYLKERVEAFEKAYPDQKFDIKIGVESESTAKDTILTDIEAAADVFSFADDQLADLADAGALLSIDSMSEVLETYAKKSLDDIKAANVDTSIEAAIYNDTFYAFPNSADNGYFLYYDSNVFTEDDVKTWDGLLAAAKKKGDGRKVGMTFASGWYAAGFFYGAGFTTGRNEDGTTTMDWNGTSPDGVTGVQVTKAMLDIAANPVFMAVTDNDMANQLKSGNLCAGVSGTWDASPAKETFGDGYAATILPTYTAGDKQVQTGSVTGCKLTGVNAHSKNSGWAVLLAEFLTNEESQQIHFKEREIGPSNINARNSDEVAQNPAISAVIAQNEFGVIQKAGGKYWDPAKTFGEMIAQGQIKNDDKSIQKALDELVEGVTAPLS